jgi:hypothetical protein
MCSRFIGLPVVGQTKCDQEEQQEHQQESFRLHSNYDNQQHHQQEATARKSFPLSFLLWPFVQHAEASDISDIVLNGGLER